MSDTPRTDAAYPDGPMTLEKVHALHDECQKIERELTAEQAKSSALEKSHDNELRKWQDEVRERFLKAFPSANIDGGGSDSGDPFDLMSAELSQGIAFAVDRIDALTSALAKTEKELKEVLAAFKCIACGDGYTPLYCRNCADKLSGTDALKAALSTAKEALELVHNDPSEQYGCTCYSDPDGTCKYCATKTRLTTEVEKALSAINSALPPK